MRLDRQLQPLLVGSRISFQTFRMTHDSISVVQRLEQAQYAISDFWSERRYPDVMNVLAPTRSMEISDYSVFSNSLEDLFQVLFRCQVGDHVRIEHVGSDSEFVEQVHVAQSPNRSRNPSSKNPPGHGSSSFPSASSSRWRTIEPAPACGSTNKIDTSLGLTG